MQVKRPCSSDGYQAVSLKDDATLLPLRNSMDIDMVGSDNTLSTETASLIQLSNAKQRGTNHER